MFVSKMMVLFKKEEKYACEWEIDLHVCSFCGVVLLQMSNLLWFPPGIFKIEDSAHVARLWGLRKNRPAMNYDKLSRSIRQYYKKGIIRKPDVSQRLVYQFVHPVWGGSVVGGVGDRNLQNWKDTVSHHHVAEHLSLRWKGDMEHVHWPTPLVHTSTANTKVTAGSCCVKTYLCMIWEEDTKQCGCWGFFFFLLQNETTKKNCLVVCMICLFIFQ